MEIGTTHASLPQSSQNADRTEHHLDLLIVFHYVLAGIVSVCALFPILHLVFGIFIIYADQIPEAEVSPSSKIIGGVFVIFSSTFIMLGQLLAILIFVAGRRLKKRTNYIYCMAIAGICCILTPLGTALGIFTIILLNKPEAQILFGRLEPLEN